MHHFYLLPIFRKPSEDRGYLKTRTTGSSYILQLAFKSGRHREGGGHDVKADAQLLHIISSSYFLATILLVNTAS